MPLFARSLSSLLNSGLMFQLLKTSLMKFPQLLYFLRVAVCGENKGRLSKLKKKENLINRMFKRNEIMLKKLFACSQTNSLRLLARSSRRKNIAADLFKIMSHRQNL